MSASSTSQATPLPRRVLLITPPSVFLLDERVFVNLGILRVASSLESQGVIVDHLDLSGIENYLEALEAHLPAVDSPVIGITTTTPQLPSVCRIIERIRSLRPEIRIVLGGPHVTLSHSAVKLEKRRGRVGRAHESFDRLQTLADTLVSGDGELAAAQAFSSGAPALIDADDPQGGLFMSHSVYESMPLPARHLVNLKSYRYSIEGHPSTSLIAQLGCPFACGFCGGRNSKSLRQIRTRSSASIVEEIRLLHETYGYTGFMFYDDELNVNKNMIDLMNALTDLQMRLGVEFRFRGFVKSQLFNADQARAMYQAGFRWLLSGFESGSPRILENMNKKATLADNTRAVETARAAGLKVKALMSIGHPGESEETVAQTQSWLRKMQPEDFDCTIITTYPGTPYFDEAVPHPSLEGVWTYICEKSGDRLHAYNVDFLKVADYYKGDPEGGYRSFVFTDHLSDRQLVESRDWIESSVRRELGISYPKQAAALRFEHSMGQGANLGAGSMILGQSI